MPELRPPPNPDPMPPKLRNFVEAEWPLTADQEATADDGTTPTQAQSWRRIFAWRSYQKARRQWLGAQGKDWCREHGYVLLHELQQFPPGLERPFE